MKRLTALLLVIIFCSISALPVVLAIGNTPKAYLPGKTIIDSDSAGGYTGDYVVIYNPSTTDSAPLSTGNLSGKIETELDDGGLESIDSGKSNAEPICPEKPYQIPVAPKSDPDVAKNVPKHEGGAVRATVGQTREFSIVDYSGWGNIDRVFEVLAVGEHCIVWTPVSASDNTHPLDEIDESFAQIAADEFDSKYDLMLSSFGEYYDPEGNEQVNLMFYNIDDGWEPGNGYVAGFFTSNDYYVNDCAMINIDTYPLIEWENMDGDYLVDLEKSYDVICHEFQHLINNNMSPNMVVWLNEMMSAASEEICYPGASMQSRIPDWMNMRNRTYLYDTDGNVSGVYTPKEAEAYSSLQYGDRLYQWDSGDANVFATYAQASLFAQYLYSQTKTNSIYKKIAEKVSAGANSIFAISQALEDTPLEGMSTSELVKNFRIALVANDNESYGGLYGFINQPGYDPGKYYNNNMDSQFEMLSPMVFTGTSAEIECGGFAVVKPKDNVFTPASNADSGLLYIGITKYDMRTNTNGNVKSDIEYYTLADEIEPNAQYLIVADGRYAMTDVSIDSELKSLQVEINDEMATGDITDSALWTFELHSGGYAIRSANGSGYVHCNRWGFPEMQTTRPAGYYFVHNFNTGMMSLEGDTPSEYNFLSGDLIGFEFYTDLFASNITLYKRETASPDDVHSVSISPDSVPVLMAGATKQLTAIIEPDTALDKSVTWSTSDESIVTVNETGLITGIADGTAQITVTTNDGGLTAVCPVTVIEPTVGAATEVSISLSTDTAPEMAQVTATANILPADYDINVITDISWEVIAGNATIQSTDNDLRVLVFGRQTGTVTIGVTVTNEDNTYCSATADLEIIQAQDQVPTEGISYVLTDEIIPGDEYIIATYVDGKYYALANAETLMYPYAPQGRELTVAEVDGQMCVTAASYSFGALEWMIGMPESEAPYTIMWKDEAHKLSATKFISLSTYDPYKTCYWNFDLQSDNTFEVTQNKFALWTNLSFDNDGKFFTVTNSDGCSISLFKKTGSEPTPTPTTEPTPTPTTEPTPTPTTEPTPTPTTEPTPTPSQYELGDANMDGKINTGDAVVVLRYCVEDYDFNDEQKSLADFNGDGNVNTGDAVSILIYCVS